MNMRCVNKRSLSIFHNKVEFKLVISALELGEDEADEHNNRHVLKIMMTSFNPVELTTRLGGPWEGCFLWNIINKRVSPQDDLSISDFMNMFQTDSDDSFDTYNNGEVLRLTSCREKTILDTTNKLNSHSVNENDYFLNVNLDKINSEFSFHLKSLSRENHAQKPNNPSLIKCLFEMLNLVKTENDTLHENIKSLSEFISNNKDRNSPVSSIHCDEKANVCSSPVMDTDSGKNTIGYYNHTHFISHSGFRNSDSHHNSNNSPNTCGTLNLSELKVLTEINGTFESNNKKGEKCSLISDKLRDHRTERHIFTDSTEGASEITEKIKTYRIIKDISSRYPPDSIFSEKKSSLGQFVSHSRDKKPSNLKSTIEIMRKAKNEFFSSCKQSQIGSYDCDYTCVDEDYNEDEYDNNSFYYRSKNKNSSYLSTRTNNVGMLRTNDDNHCDSRRDELIGGCSILSKDQLLNRLSEVSDISERIDILKRIIKGTKRDKFLTA